MALDQDYRMQPGAMAAGQQAVTQHATNMAQQAQDHTANSNAYLAETEGADADMLLQVNKKFAEADELGHQASSMYANAIANAQETGTAADNRNAANWG